jgi:hypothetical protein
MQATHISLTDPRFVSVPQPQPGSSGQRSCRIRAYGGFALDSDPELLELSPRSDPRTRDGCSPVKSVSEHGGARRRTSQSGHRG